MVDFRARLSDAWRRRDAVLPLAFVPFVSAFLDWSNIVRVIDFRGGHLGINFRFPSAVADVWTFVSVPNQGSAVAGGPTILIPVAIAVQAALAAAYLGSLRDATESGEYDVLDNARRYFLRMFGYQLLAVLLVLATVGGGVAGGSGAAVLLVIVLIPIYLLLAYLFYATPYLVVIRDAGLIEALRGSYEHAVEAGDYLSFAVQYLVAVALLSIVGTAVVVNLGVVGIIVGAVAAAPVALTLNLATLDFLSDLEEAR